jgi:hypothetical protein
MSQSVVIENVDTASTLDSTVVSTVEIQQSEQVTKQKKKKNKKRENNIVNVLLDKEDNKNEDSRTLWDMIPSVETTKNIKGNLEMKRGDVKKFDQQNIPTVSIVTITYNRKKYFDIAINNFMSYMYDRSKLEWIIVDDTEKKEDQLFDLIDPLLQQGQNIKYVLLNKHTNVGKKRNIGCELAKGDFIIMMDDDDIYFSDSILSKVITLTTHDKQICFTRPLAVLDVKNMSSYIIEGFEDVAEASVCMTKKYWNEVRKFDDTVKNGEGKNLVAGNERLAIELPYYFNFICIQHNTNLTGRMRQIRYMVGMKNALKIQKMQTIKTQRNFFKDFNKQTQTILRRVFNL